MPKRIISSLLVLLITLFLTVSCADAPVKETDGTRPDETGSVWFPSIYPTETERIVGASTPREQTVVVATEAGLTDWAAPFRALSHERNGPIRLIYESLFTFDEATQRVLPHLAESLTDDGRELIIRLPEARTWQDGRQITAADVLYTIALKRRIDLSRPDLPVREVDGRTVAIEYADSVAKSNILWELSTLLIVPAHIFQPLEDRYPADRLPQIQDSKLVGSGPYTLETADEYVVRLRAVQGNVPPYIEIPRFGDDNSRTEAFLSGRADFYYGERKLEEAAESFSGREMLFGIVLNAERLPLRDPVVRQSLLKSIRSYLVAGALRESADEISPYQFFFGQSRVSQLAEAALLPGAPSYDPAQAGEAMEKAGYVRKDGAYALKGDVRLTVVYVDGRRESAAMMSLKHECEANGFQLELTPLSPPAYAEARTNRAFDLALDVYPVEESPDAMKARILALVDAFVRPTSPLYDEAFATRIQALAGALSAESGESVPTETKLSQEIQKRFVFLSLGSSPGRYLNVRHDYWQGDLRFLADVAVSGDPFGPEAVKIFSALRPAARSD